MKEKIFTDFAKKMIQSLRSSTTTRIKIRVKGGDRRSHYKLNLTLLFSLILYPDVERTMCGKKRRTERREKERKEVLETL